MRKLNPEDLTVRQIHYRLLEKRGTMRQSRLVFFHRTGRAVPVLGESIVEDQFKAVGSFRSIPSKSLIKAERTWLDGLLLGAEILAVIGFLAVVGIGLSTLDSFNRASAESIRKYPLPNLYNRFTTASWNNSILTLSNTQQCET